MIRSSLAAVAGLVAAAALLLAIPTWWVQLHVVDRAGYVGLTSELATDREVQTAFAGYLVDDYVQRGVLPTALQSLATTTVTEVVRTTAARPGFVEAWGETQGTLHDSAFADPAGPLVLDLGPLAQFVAGRVGDLLPVSLDVAGSLPVQVGDEQDRQDFHDVKRLGDAAKPLTIAGVVAALLALLLARSRFFALAWLGAGAVLVAALVHGLMTAVTPGLLDSNGPQTPFARSLVDVLADRVASSLDASLLRIVIGGVAVVLVGLVGRAIGGRFSRA